MVPKKYRDLLGLVAGSEVEIECDGSEIRVRPPTPKTEIEQVDGVWVVKSKGDGRLITGDTIRQVLEATRDRLL